MAWLKLLPLTSALVVVLAFIDDWEEQLGMSAELAEHPAVRYGAHAFFGAIAASFSFVFLLDDLLSRRADLLSCFILLPPLAGLLAVGIGKVFAQRYGGATAFDRFAYGYIGVFSMVGFRWLSERL